jgi:hypothetical protein
MGASLADGKVIDGCVECHWHHWKFDLETGQGDQRSWARAAVWEVKIADDRVWLRSPGHASPAPEPAADEEEEWIRWDPERFFKKRQPERTSDGGSHREEGADQADHQTDDEQ